MAVKRVEELTNIGDIAEDDKLVGERVDGTTVRIQYTSPVAPAGSSGKRLKSDGTTWVNTNTTMPDAGTSRKLIVGDGTNYVETTETWAAPGTTGKRLKSDGTNWVNTTAAMPDSGTSRKLIVGDGTNYVETTETWAVPGSSGNVLTSDGTNWTSAAPTSGALVNNFRLTLTSGTPVTTSDVTGATTIYCTPYDGNKISLYSSGSWGLYSSAEFSLALGTLSSGKPYDVFAYNNSGTPTLEFLVWTNDTTRATALTKQDGIYVKSGDATRRYLGTFYTTSTTATEDSRAKRYLWNYYHRCTRSMLRYESAVTWNYTTATFRQANDNTDNQLNFILGVAEDSISVQLLVRASNGTANVNFVGGLGVDSASAEATSYAYLRGEQYTQVSNINLTQTASLEAVIAAGRHFVAWLEYSQASGTTTWVGNSQFGLTGNMRA